MKPEAKSIASALVIYTLLVLVVFFAFLRGEIPYFYDMKSLHLPYRFELAQSLKQGVIPLWIHEIYCGFPLFAEGETGMLYPPTFLLFLLFSTVAALQQLITSHYVVAGMGAFLLARRFDIASYGAFLCGAIYMLCGFMVAHLHQLNIIIGAALFPWVLYSLLGYIESRHRGLTARYAVMLLLFLAFQLLGSHPQVTFYTLLMVIYLAFYYGARLPGENRAKAWSVPLLLVIAMLLGAAQTIPTLELSMHSIRAGGLSGSEVIGGSFHPLHLITLLHPYFFGAPNPIAGGDYWGKPFFWEQACYLGLWSILLIGLGISQKNRRLMPIKVAFIASLLLMLGKYGFIHCLLAYLPGFSLFRIPARFSMVFCLCGALLAGAGLEKLLQLLLRRIIPRWTIEAIVIIAAISLLIYFAGSIIANHKGEIQQLYQQQRTYTQNTDSPKIIKAIFNSTSPGNLRNIAQVSIALCGLLILVFAILWRNPRWLPHGLSLLVIIDLCLFARGYNPSVPDSDIQLQPGYIRFLQADGDLSRVHYLQRLLPKSSEPAHYRAFITSDTTMIHNIKSIMTTSTLRMAEHDRYLRERVVWGIGKPYTGGSLGDSLPAMAKIGVRYLVSFQQVEDERAKLVYQATLPVMQAETRKSRRLQIYVYQIPLWVDQKTRTASSISNRDIILRRNRITAELDGSQERLSLPLNDYPGWRAYLGDIKLDIIDNQVIIPAGTQNKSGTITARFEPYSYRIGTFISLLSLALLACYIINHKLTYGIEAKI